MDAYSFNSLEAPVEYSVCEPNYLKFDASHGLVRSIVWLLVQLRSLTRMSSDAVFVMSAVRQG
jgi:hypothetical protein